MTNIFIHLKHRQGLFTLVDVKGSRLYCSTKYETFVCDKSQFKCFAGGIHSLLVTEDARNIFYPKVIKDKTYYRELFKEHHPDRGGDVEKFRQVYAEYQAYMDS